jgi:hypothetical protein
MYGSLFGYPGLYVHETPMPREVRDSMGVFGDGGGEWGIGERGYARGVGGKVGVDGGGSEH